MSKIEEIGNTVEKKHDEMEIEWEIEDFFTIAENKQAVECPAFSFVGTPWRLQLTFKSDFKPGGMCLFIKRMNNLYHSVEYNFGLKRCDGVVEHVTKGTFEADKNWKGHSIKLSELQQRKSELVFSDALIIVCKLKLKTTHSYNQTVWVHPKDTVLNINDQEPHCSPRNLNHIPSQQSAQNPQSQVPTGPLLRSSSVGTVTKNPAKNLRPKFKTENVGLINAAPNVPGDVPNNPTVVKDWHQFYPRYLRDCMVEKIVQKIFPSIDMSKLQDPSMINIVTYAQKVEEDMFRATNSREEYYQMIAEKIFKIHKELEEERQRKKVLRQQQQAVGGLNLAPMSGDNAAASPKLDVLSENIKDLSITKDSCDTVLQVKYKEFKVHKSILMARSPVFAAMFQHDTLEKQTGFVDIPDCDPESFQEFLEYLYFDKLKVTSYCSAFQLYIIAKKYDVQKLKEYCVEYLVGNLTADNVCDIVKLADKYSDEKLMLAAQAFFNENQSKISVTTEWKSLVKNYYHLANKLSMKLSVSKGSE